MEGMARLRTAEGRWIAWGLSQAGEPLAILLASGAAITVLAMARLRRSAMALALATAIGLLAALGLDGLLGVDAVPDGFPSIHATGIALLAGGMALMQSSGGARRKTALGLAGCAVTVVAVSRVYLGATLPLAALAGAALGAVALAGVAFLRDSAAAPRRAMVAGLIALLAGACYTGWQEQRQGLDAYPKPFVAPRVSADADCERAVAELGQRPGYALWQGSHGRLMGLARRGWPPAEPWTLRGSLQWLRPSPDPAELPPVPAILEGRGPEVSLQRVTLPEAERRLLHAWPAARGANREWSWWWLRAVRERLIPAWPVTLAKTEPAELPGGLNTLGRLCPRPGDAG